jgi:hypothetical protein
MKKQILSEEFKRMQKLAGILNESTLFPPNSISDFGNKHFDEIQNMFGKIRSEFQGTKTKGIEVAFAGSDEDDGIDISFDPKFEEMSDVYNEIESVEIAGKTIYVNNYLNSNIDDDDEDEENAIEVAFQSSSKMVPWNVIEKTYTESGLTGEEFFADVEDEFRSKFENKPVNRDEYYKFFIEQPNVGGQDDLYTMVNWINFTNPKLADKLYNMI